MLERLWRGYVSRRFSQSSVLRFSEKVKSEPTSAQSPQQNETMFDTSMSVKPSEWDKKILVFSGKYKSKEEIPSRIRYETMDNAKSRVRIKVANLMIVTTLVACVCVVFLGKKRQKEGDSLLKRRLAVEDKLREEGRLRRAGGQE